MVLCCKNFGVKAFMIWTMKTPKYLWHFEVQILVFWLHEINPWVLNKLTFVKKRILSYLFVWIIAWGESSFLDVNRLLSHVGEGNLNWVLDGVEQLDDHVRHHLEGGPPLGTAWEHGIPDLKVKAVWLSRLSNYILVNQVTELGTLRVDMFSCLLLYHFEIVNIL